VLPFRHETKTRVSWINWLTKGGIRWYETLRIIVTITLLNWCGLK
jgi:hypothetical protein